MNGYVHIRSKMNFLDWLQGGTGRLIVRDAPAKIVIRAAKVIAKPRASKFAKYLDLSLICGRVFQSALAPFGESR